MSKALRFPVVAVCAFLAMAGVANAQTYTAYLSSAQEVPANASTATGYARVFINEAGLSLSYTVVFTGLTSNQTAAHIHNAGIGVNGTVMIDFGPGLGTTSGTISGGAPVTLGEIAEIRAGRGYINVHSMNFPGGEIRGQLALRRVVDYDGDGRTDYAVLRFPSTGSPKPITQWNFNSTTGYQVVPWGDANVDFPCPGDYDGDAVDDICVYRAGQSAGEPSYFFILRSSDSEARVAQWGLFGDMAVVRDYDGDGITDLAIFRRGASAGAQTAWWILESRTSTVRIVPFGLTGNGTTSFDAPVPQDYDGDGKIDVAVYRFGLSPANTYIVLRSSDGQVSYANFGDFSTDYVVPGDYDADGKGDYAVARTGAAPSDPMVWWILHSSNSQLHVAQFGISSDRPAPGDFDGDGKTDVTVARDVAGTGKVFYTIASFTNTFIIKQWGIVGDFVVGTFSIF